ncbi:MAG: hypothetical protein WAT92_15880 [Saprospiraceae bacterium]
MKSNSTFCKSMLFLLLLNCTLPFQSALIGQAQTLEFFTGAGNPTGTSVQTSQTLTFQNNTNNITGNAIAPYIPVTTATFTLSNQQFASIEGNSTIPGAVIGGGITGTSNTYPNGPLFSSMNFLSGSSNGNYSSCPTCIGTGIDITTNRSLNLQLNTDALISSTGTNNQLLNARVYYADLTITFNQPMDNPILHLTGLGGIVSSTFNSVTSYLGFSTELDLLTSGITMTELSGSSAFNIVGSTIRNTATNFGPATAGSTTGTVMRFAASGSVLLGGTNITSVSFRVYLRGDGGQDPNGGTAPNPTWSTTSSVSGDGFLLGISEAIEICNDNIDNDADGLPDCLDPECAGMAVCGENCTSPGDDDGDGLINESDPDCFANVAFACPPSSQNCQIDWRTPTTVSGNLLTYQVPCSGRTITVTVERVANSGGYNMSTLTSGSLQGAWLGMGSNSAPSTFENYKITFSEPVYNTRIGFWAINDNCDGDEDLTNWSTNGSSTTNFDWLGVAGAMVSGGNCGPNDGGNAPIFNGTAVTGFLDNPLNTSGPGSCCDDGGYMNIQNTTGFTELFFTRDVITSRPFNFTNGIVLGGTTSSSGVSSFCVSTLKEICCDNLDNDGDGLIDEGDVVDCPDKDMDGVANECDLDNDNDGIVNTTEDACMTPVPEVNWFNNSNTTIMGDRAATFRLNGSSVASSPYVSSTGLMTFGSGLGTVNGTSTPAPGSGNGVYDDQFEYDIRATVDASSFAQAKTNGDYVQMTVTMSQDALLTNLATGLTPINSGGSATGNYFIAVEVSNNGTFAGSQTLLVQDFFHKSPPNNTTYQYSDLDITPYLLQAGMTYTFRWYVYNELNSLLPDNSITIDDFYYVMTCISDLDGDGITNSCDLDADGDGCPDALEAGWTGITATSGYDPADSMLTAAVNVMGVPTSAAGQTPFTPNTGVPASLDPFVQGPACPMADKDMDGVADKVDLDDDNDGILDSDEKNCGLSATWTNVGTGLGGTTF